MLPAGPGKAAGKLIPTGRCRSMARRTRREEVRPLLRKRGKGVGAEKNEGRILPASILRDNRSLKELREAHGRRRFCRGSWAVFTSVAGDGGELGTAGERSGKTGGAAEGHPHSCHLHRRPQGAAARRPTPGTSALRGKFTALHFFCKERTIGHDQGGNGRQRRRLCRPPAGTPRHAPYSVADA